MTLDELFEKYYEAWSAVARQTDGDRQSAGRAGVTAIVRALRDELSKCDWDEGENMIDALDEILGDAGAEKVAGGSTREDGPGGVEQAVPALTLATDAAPAVCEWTGEEYVTYSTSCESEHEVDPHKAPPTYCPSCGKPIAFTEANHG